MRLSEGFKRKLEGINSSSLSKIFEFRLRRAKLIRYNARGFGFQDIRKVFKQTKEEDKELIEYYSKGIGDKTPDDIKVRTIVSKINRRLEYITDDKNFGKVEYWESPINIHRRMKDDCDGYAVLACYVAGLLGIPAWRRFVRAGYILDDKGVRFGHATFVYLSLEDLEFYALEGSYYPSKTFNEFGKLPLRKSIRYDKTWWITNEEKSYSPNWIFKWVR